MMEMGEVVKRARLNGIRPMPIERLLPYLGYGISQPVAARPQAKDIGGIRRASDPR
jgi:hypothetical protein